MSRENLNNSIAPHSLRDVLAAAFLALCVFFLAFSSVDNSCYWGDDFAAYISQGIAMAENTLDDQARLNVRMHPSPLPMEAGDELVYVWGYPLILAGIYKLVGFDRTAFSSIIYYKMPSVFALSLLAAVLYLFYRRRFGAKLSFLLALLFCCCGEMFDFLNTLYSDMVFLFLSMLSLLLFELFLEKRGKWPYAVIFGLSLWFMYEVRLNGVSILLACILGHIFALFPRVKELNIRRMLPEFVPYLVFTLLVFLSQFLIAKATSNTSDIGSGMSFALFAENLKSYMKLIWHWLGLLWNSLLINPLYSVSRRFLPVSFDSFTPFREILVGASCLLCFAGLILDGLRKNTHLSILVVVYIIIVSALPYTQGLRYIYPLLPLLMMYAGYTLSRLGGLSGKLTGRLCKLLRWSLTVLCCFFIVYPHVSAALSGEKGVREVQEIASPSDIYTQNAYSSQAVEMYNYIRSNTDEKSTIAFFAPRALYLNTQRVAVRPGVNGHSIEEADYYLQYLNVGDYPVDKPPESGFTVCFSNEQFVLFERVKSGK